MNVVLASWTLNSSMWRVVRQSCSRHRGRLGWLEVGLPVPVWWVYFRVAFRPPSVECGNSESKTTPPTMAPIFGVFFFDDAPGDSEDVAFGDFVFDDPPEDSEDVLLGDCVFDDPPEDSEDVVLSVSTLALKKRSSSTP